MEGLKVNQQSSSAHSKLISAHDLEGIPNLIPSPTNTIK
jgi:hypothetical protein